VRQLLVGGAVGERLEHLLLEVDDVEHEVGAAERGGGGGHRVRDVGGVGAAHRADEAAQLELLG